MSLLVLFSICVNLRHLWIRPEKLASFVAIFTIEDKLESCSAQIAADIHYLKV